MPCKGIALPAELPARSLILYNKTTLFVNQGFYNYFCYSRT
jgi:hypothetical protein